MRHVARVAQYLVAIYELERTGGTSVSSGRVAQTLGRSPAAATEMIDRLESDGLVGHEPYDGVVLTPEGRERAADLYRTYATLRVFFRDVLDVEDYEDGARALAGVVSADTVERLEETLLDGETKSDAKTRTDGAPDASGDGPSEE